MEPVPAVGQLQVPPLLCETFLGRLIQVVFSEWI